MVEAHFALFKVVPGLDIELLNKAFLAYENTQYFVQ